MGKAVEFLEIHHLAALEFTGYLSLFVRVSGLGQMTVADSTRGQVMQAKKKKRIFSAELAAKASPEEERMNRKGEGDVAH